MNWFKKVVFLVLSFGFLSILNADNHWKGEAKKWTAQKDKDFNSQMDKTSSVKGGAGSAAGKASAAMNMTSKYGSKLGLSSSTTSALGSASGALNALMNDGLASIAGQYAGSLLPDSMQKYFKICYKKNKPSPSSDFDPCSLLDMGLIDVCKTLPELPGYTKLNSIDQEFDLLETLTSIPSSGPGSLRDMCDKKLNSKKTTPKSKTTIKEKIVNADPVASIENKRLAANNTNVKSEVKNSDVTSDTKVSQITVVKKLPDGTEVKTMPFSGITKNNSQAGMDAKRYIKSIAEEEALEGGTQEDIEKNLKVLALNPTAVNVTFENDLQHEMGRGLISKDRVKSKILVADYRGILREAGDKLKDPNQPPDIEELKKGYQSTYDDMVDAWVEDEIAFYASTNKTGVVSPTKDYVDNAVKGSNDELLERMAIVTRIREQTNSEADKIATIVLKGEALKRNFEIDLDKTIIVAMPFDIDAARSAAGLEPVDGADKSGGGSSSLGFGK